MKAHHVLIAGGFIALAGFATWNHAAPPSGSSFSSSSDSSSSSSSSALPLAEKTTCQSINGNPDPSCTPGDVDPNCGLAQVKQSGYSATVRPPVSVTNPEKIKVEHLYGMDGIAQSTVEGDHLVPISLCGCPGPGHNCNFDSNFWPESWLGPTGAHAKDAVELRMLKAVRAGTVTLAQAQSCLAIDWKSCP